MHISKTILKDCGCMYAIALKGGYPFKGKTQLIIGKYMSMIDAFYNEFQK